MTLIWVVPVAGVAAGNEHPVGDSGRQLLASLGDGDRDGGIGNTERRQLVGDAVAVFGVGPPDQRHHQRRRRRARRPIRRRPLRVGEEVYAIGTPYERTLRASVTRGIVSALRIEEGTNQPIIQSDADIQGGSSGGPLVDASGNVVGISVSGVFEGPKKLSSGLNFFIPIHDALKKLGLRYGK